MCVCVYDWYAPGVSTSSSLMHTYTHTSSHTLKGNTHLLGLCRRSKIICYASMCWQCVSSVLQCVAVCCSVLQCAAACEHIFFDCVVGTILFATPQRGAVCRSVLAVCCSVRTHLLRLCRQNENIGYASVCCNALQYVAVCCSGFQCIAVCEDTFFAYVVGTLLFATPQCGATWCSVLQCVAVSGGMLQFANTPSSTVLSQQYY